jgi:hypothetical protein
MSFLVSSPSLSDGETVRWSLSANRAERWWYASGGKLFVTDRRILFQPNRLDSLFGKQTWECPLSRVKKIEGVDRSGTEALAGGSRRRLAIGTPEGVELFVVRDSSRTALKLKDFLDL